MKKLLIISLAVLTLAACSTEETKEESTTESLEMTAEQLSLILDTAYIGSVSIWDSLLTQDDKKMSDIRRLIDEISFNPKHEEAKVAELRSLFEEVEGLRYTQANLDGDAIDQYDLMQDSLMSAAFMLAGATPEMENYPLALELVNDIESADEKVVLYRSEYDTYASIYNGLLIQYSAMQKSTTHADKVPFGTFAVIEE